jgi:hypothetical protein
MGKLHEVLAVEDSLGKVSRRKCEDAIKTFKGQDNLFRGHLVEVKALKEEVDDLATAVVTGGNETHRVAETVHGKLTDAIEAWAEHVDAIAQKEHANTKARADVLINGEAILKDVPATTLLSLEARLNDLRAVLVAVPTRDMAKVWHASEFDWVWQTTPERRVLTHKAEKSEVVIQPTEHQPGQFRTFIQPVNVAEKSITHLTSMPTPDERQRMIDRLDELARACKVARQKANEEETEARDVGKALSVILLKM